MAFKIRSIDYFYITVKDQPGEAYKLLSQIAELGINLLAFSVIPFSNEKTQIKIFPEDTHKTINEANNVGLVIDGPHPAFLVKGDDELGALVDIHKKLYDTNVNIYASNGITDGKGTYCYILHVRPDDHKKAAEVLEI